MINMTVDLKPDNIFAFFIFCYVQVGKTVSKVGLRCSVNKIPQVIGKIYRKIGVFPVTGKVGEAEFLS
jgi:hypothetical protein